MTDFTDHAPRGFEQVQRRVTRVLRVAALITREPSAWTRADLAAHFAVSERGIDRDLEILRGIGYTIRRSKAGYEIESGAGLPEPPPPKDDRLRDSLWPSRVR